MDIKKIIQKIIDDGKVEYMHELSDILEDVLEILEKYDENCYNKYKMQLYTMAYGYHITEEMAYGIVHNMKPYGEKWTIQETQNIQKQFGLDNIDYIDFYLVMNQGYNDYNNLFKDKIENYVMYADDFINDEDARKDKIFLYFTQIPEN